MVLNQIWLKIHKTFHNKEKITLNGRVTSLLLLQEDLLVIWLLEQWLTGTLPSSERYPAILLELCKSLKAELLWLLVGLQLFQHLWEQYLESFYGMLVNTFSDNTGATENWKDIKENKDFKFKTFECKMIGSTLFESCKDTKSR